MNGKWKSGITRYPFLLLMPVIATLAGCGQDADMNSSQTIENVEPDAVRVNNEEVGITQNRDEAELQQEEITPAEVYQLFLNGELTAAQGICIKQENEPEEERVAIRELFWGNDIEYCFGDIDGDGSEELHIRDDVVYYVIKAVDGMPQILFEGWWGYEPVVTDELCGILYDNYGYTSEKIEFIMISADGSTESDGEFWWFDENKNGAMDKEDHFRGWTNYDEIDMEQYVHYREEQTTKRTKNELEWKNRRLKDFATWQEAYIDFINKPESTIWTSENSSDYSLIYVDEDDIPELYIHTGGMATGAFMVSFYDGKVRAMNRGRGGIQYLEYSGRFYSDWGNMGFYPCNVYMLEKGEFSEIGTGWISENNDVEKEDTYYDYFWEGSLMTETEYRECLNKLIDTSKCIEPEKLYTQDEMLEILVEANVIQSLKL